MRQDTNLAGVLAKKASGNIDKTPKIHLDEVDLQILTTLNKQIPIEQNIPLIKKIIKRRTKDIVKFKLRLTPKVKAKHKRYSQRMHHLANAITN